MSPTSGALAVIAVLCASIPALAGDFVAESAPATDDCRGRDAPAHSSINVSAALDSASYLPGDNANVRGSLAYEDGSNTSDAYVSAALWGGTFLGSGASGASGEFSIPFLVPSLPGNYTVTVTAEKGALNASADLLLVVLSEANGAPVISDLSCNPQNVTAGDDVLVCATVTDDHGVRAVWLAFRLDGGNYTRMTMNLSVGNRRIGSIPRQPAGTQVEFYIEAFDGALRSFLPPGAPAGVFGFSVENGTVRPSCWLGLTASLNGTDFLPGRPYLLSGSVQNGTGGAVAGALVTLEVVNLPAAGRESRSDARGVFRLEGIAPPAPGNYTLLLNCSLGPAANSTALALSVRDRLGSTVYLSSVSVRPSNEVNVSGRILRSDGSPAAGADICVTVTNSSSRWAGRTDEQGRFSVPIKAPARAGRQLVTVKASFAGMTDEAQAVLEVREPVRRAGGLTGPLALAAAALVLLLVSYRRGRP